MDFVNFDYEENRAIDYKKLVEYFAERNPDGYIKSPMRSHTCIIHPSLQYLN